jgi:hypothetical protein
MLQEAQASRLPWLLLKQFPNLLGVAHLDDLTVEQETWLLAQHLLDQGMALCPQCQEPGTGRFCEHCGTPRAAAPRQTSCPTCHTLGSGAFCGGCGTRLAIQTTQALDDGSFDWETWEQQMQPFLGGLSATEQQYLNGGPGSLPGWSLSDGDSGPDDEL